MKLTVTEIVVLVVGVVVVAPLAAAVPNPPPGLPSGAAR